MNKSTSINQIEFFIKKLREQKSKYDERNILETVIYGELDDSIKNGLTVYFEGGEEENITNLFNVTFIIKTSDRNNCKTLIQKLHEYLNNFNYNEDEYFIYVLTTTVPLAVEKIGDSFYCTFEAEIRTGELYE